MLSLTLFNLPIAMPLTRVTLRKGCTGHAFFPGLIALGFCYKSVKKLTFSGHASVMSVPNNSALTILTIHFQHHYIYSTHEPT